MSEQENAPDRENENVLREKRVQAGSERAQQTSEKPDKGGHPPDMRPAGVLIRGVARFIDGVIFWVVFFLLGFLLDYVTPFLSGGSRADLLYLLQIVAGVSYETLLTASAWQGTVGKRALEIKVVRGNGGKLSLGQSFGRYLAFILTCLVLYAMVAGLGFFFMFVGLPSDLFVFVAPLLILVGLSRLPRKRLPHDLLASTYVIHVGKGRRRSSRRRKVKVSASTEAQGESP